jgi:NAD dependent epimerase/dehydratase family enzyme
VGPVNACSPQPATNAQFVAALAGALHRPAFIPMPEFVVRAVFGEMGEETLLASQRAAPRKLLDTGFVFQYPGIGQACVEALRHH